MGNGFRHRRSARARARARAWLVGALVLLALPAVGSAVAMGQGGAEEARHPAKLEISRNTIDRGDRRLDVLAPITKRASGKVEVELHAAGERYRFDAAVNSAKGYVRFDKRIPRAQARLGTGIVTITYPGNERTRGQEVRLRAAGGKAGLDAQRPELQAVGGQLRLRSQGELSPRARGVVRVQLDWVDAAGANRSYETNAKIDDGQWRLSEALPDEVAQSIEGRRSTVHSYTLFTGYLRARMRGEMQAYQVLPALDLATGAVPMPRAPTSDSASTAPPTAPSSGSTAPTRPPSPSALSPGETLHPGDRLESPSGAYRLVMQGDGNLVLYKGTSALWSSDTRTAGSRAVMQSDGNLVVYSGSTPEWFSRTTGFDGARLLLQDDGNMVLYHAGRAVWSYRSGYIGNRLLPENRLTSGAVLRSSSGAYRLVMQGDGNLVLYRGSTAVWNTDPRGAGSSAVMQGDGNLVVYSGSVAKWQSNTAGFPKAHLLVQDDGNLVVYHSGRGVWTYGRGYIGDTLDSGRSLPSGSYLRSADGRYRLVMQADDGNLALYGPSGSVWSFGTAGYPGAGAIMQEDGNFVVYSGSRALRHTQTAGQPSAFLRLQNDANLVVYKGSAALWSRTTGPIGDGSGIDPGAPASAAARWAVAQVGQRTASSEDAALFGDWVPGPYGEWSGDCAKFAFAAWYRAGVSIVRGDAKQKYEAYRSRIQGGTPPSGALVFWPNVTDYGHIAIADGSGGVYTTQGLDDDNLPIAHIPATYFGEPAGWVIP